MYVSSLEMKLIVKKNAVISLIISFLIEAYIKAVIFIINWSFKFRCSEKFFEKAELTTKEELYKYGAKDMERDSLLRCLLPHACIGQSKICLQQRFYGWVPFYRQSPLVFRWSNNLFKQQSAWTSLHREVEANNAMWIRLLF